MGESGIRNSKRRIKRKDRSQVKEDGGLMDLDIDEFRYTGFKPAEYKIVRDRQGEPAIRNRKTMTPDTCLTPGP